MTTWPNEKAALAGYLAGKGHSASEIAKLLGDGTREATTRRMLSSWGLPSLYGDPIAIELKRPLRRKLGQQAAVQGLMPSEYLRHICVCAIEDDMYNAIVDGRFE